MSPASGSARGWRPPPRPHNHTDTPHHCHCNDSPGTNVIQLSSTSLPSGWSDQPLQAKHIPPAAPAQAQDMLHCPTPTTARQGQCNPANPTPKPRRCPRML
ncbi:hypothetical protein AMECASPLE_036462, partial [Ameca splendens]